MKTARARLAMGAALAAVCAAPLPALAQDGEDARLRRLEAEVRALQRQVFPGGDPRFFEPEITGAAPAPSSPVPTNTPVTDVLARVDALELAVQRLTGQVEVNTNTLQQMAGRLDAMERAAAAPPAPTGTAPAGPSTQMPAGNRTPATVATAPTASAAPPEPAPATPSPARLAAVSQIAKPQTADPADDEYSYGFRLWEAGFYPEAQQQLTMFVETYPGHSRISWGRNLLGRAYLDDGKPRDAAAWFIRNYQADRNAARAGDSLLFLAEAMIAMDDTSRACIALAEFSETYPALAAGRLQSQYEADRARVTCSN